MHISELNKTLAVLYAEQELLEYFDDDLREIDEILNSKLGMSMWLYGFWSQDRDFHEETYARFLDGEFSLHYLETHRDTLLSILMTTIVRTNAQIGNLSFQIEESITDIDKKIDDEWETMA